MKISNSKEKQVLAELFWREKTQFNPMTGQNVTLTVPREFDIGQLIDASSAKKKLDKGAGIFTDEEIELTEHEVALLKPLFQERQSWNILLADAVLSLTEKFK